ncbi:HemK/PrmC family methyltransferase [Porphyromonadaceae bacterium W3.11]|nr:HemK/PrmC family methyltransferase [Porphyromonadaceae bacterium W3.11]
MSEFQVYKQSISERLASYYTDVEAEQMARLLLQEAYGIPYPRLVFSDCKVSEKYAIVEAWVKRLEALEPLQYVVGHTYFHGMELLVRKGVLIPRGETEQLCQILRDRGYVSEDAITADLCTGSAAIALYLATHGCVVEAVDISPLALEVAGENIERLGMKRLVNLRAGDLLSEQFEPFYPAYDLVVSNPPYVLDSERSEIKPHVLQMEPELALFVPDDDGLRFYRAILGLYGSRLKVGGVFAFEINPLVVDELIELYSSAGYDVSISEDYLGRKRFLFAKKVRND